MGFFWVKKREYGVGLLVRQVSGYIGSIPKDKHRQSTESEALKYCLKQFSFSYLYCTCLQFSDVSKRQADEQILFHAAIINNPMLLWNKIIWNKSTHLFVLRKLCDVDKCWKKHLRSIPSLISGVNLRSFDSLFSSLVVLIGPSDRTPYWSHFQTKYFSEIKTFTEQENRA